MRRFLLGLAVFVVGLGLIGFAHAGSFHHRAHNARPSNGRTFRINNARNLSRKSFKPIQGNIVGKGLPRNGIVGKGFRGNGLFHKSNNHLFSPQFIWSKKNHGHLFSSLKKHARHHRHHRGRGQSSSDDGDSGSSGMDDDGDTPGLAAGDLDDQGNTPNLVTAPDMNDEADTPGLVTVDLDDEEVVTPNTTTPVSAGDEDDEDDEDDD